MQVARNLKRMKNKDPEIIKQLEKLSPKRTLEEHIAIAEEQLIQGLALKFGYLYTHYDSSRFDTFFQGEKTILLDFLSTVEHPNYIRRKLKKVKTKKRPHEYSGVYWLTLKGHKYGLSFIEHDDGTIEWYKMLKEE